MSKIKTLIALAILSVAFSTTTHAVLTPLDFTGWDPAVLSTNGGTQIFPNILPGIDVEVTSTGEFDAPTSLIGNGTIQSQHDPATNSASHAFTFCFSSPVNAEVFTFSLDADEQYDIFSDGAESYTNLSGALPTVTPAGFGVLLNGVAYGQDPLLGAADGVTHIAGANCLTVNYSGIAPNTKYGTFSLSAMAVPEPNAGVLMLIGGLGLIGSRRRRRR